MAQQENFNRQAPVALLAIAEHMVEHGLPAPWSIDISPTDQAIRIRTLSTQHEAWLSSVEVVDEHTELLEGGIGVRASWTLQLPVGVVFNLVTFRADPILTVVPA